jgi:subtilisin family serine protease
MRRSRMVAVAGAVALATSALGVTAASAQGSTAAQASGEARSYVVLASDGADLSALSDRLTAAGATVTRTNTAIGMLTVTSTDSGFAAEARAMTGVKAAAADRAIGYAPKLESAKPDPIEKEHVFTKTRANGSAKLPPAPEGGDPMDGLLWGMDMIDAFEAHGVNTGEKVRVGVMDTGIDASHIDLRDNFDATLSHNFTTDAEDPAGALCQYGDCVDPKGVDDNGHGTHVAGTIGAALNGVGVSGVAPDVDLVNVRAGQDSGYFLLGPVVDALTYSADVGIDVVNMSFYVDPWLYNCEGGAPEDNDEEAASQDAILSAMREALTYANDHGVTLVGALGNEASDLANPGTDSGSPDYDFGEGYVGAHDRTIDNATCFDMPVEGPFVVGVSSLGPSERKAAYSNYTTDPTSGEIEVSAPGGWYRDGLGTDSFRTNGNLILSTASMAALQANGEVDKNGNITHAGRANGVLKACENGKHNENTSDCSYYEWLQGTSMASPHAAGVASLVVGAHGSGDSADTFGLAPAETRSFLMSTARDHACPDPATVSYTDVGRPESWTATCVGTEDFNGFYGDGIVNALNAVS